MERQRLEQIMLQQDLEENRKLKVAQKQLKEQKKREQAALIAKKANVEKLIIGHYSSRYKDISLFKKEAEEIFNTVILAEAGKVISIK